MSAPFRFANDLHIDTRDSVIESQLLFRKGDPVSQRLFEETERNLRDRRYLREPSVRTVTTSVASRATSMAPTQRAPSSRLPRLLSVRVM